MRLHWCALIPGLLSACESDPVIPRLNPSIEAFTASAEIVPRGGSVLLTWRVRDASSVAIRAMPSGATLASTSEQTGSVVSPPIDVATTFELTIEGDPSGGKTERAEVSVTIEPGKGPTILSFDTVDAAITIGDSTELIWNVDGADQISVATVQGFVLLDAAPLRGSITIAPTTDSLYRIEATNGFGTDTATAAVAVNQIGGPVVRAFAANPTTITVGDSATLTWDVTNAERILISDGVDSFDSTDSAGTWIVTPERSAIYSLTALGAGGQTARAQASVTVEPGPPVILSCDLGPNPTVAGSEIHIRWDALEVQEARILRESTEIFQTTTDPNTGDVTTVIDESGNYRLELTSPFGSNLCSWYARAHRPPVIDRFDVLVAPGADTQITWAVRDAARLELLLNGAPEPSFPAYDELDTSDSQGTLALSVNGVIELVAESAGGLVTRRINAGIFEVESNDTSAVPNALGAAELSYVEGVVGGTDEDWFSIEVPDGWSLYVDASNGDSCTADTSIYLHRAPSTTALTSDLADGVGACARLDPAFDSVMRNLVGGTYWIRVDKGSSTGEGAGLDGPYLLVVRASPPGVCGNRYIDAAGEECDGDMIGTTPFAKCGADCRVEPDAEVIISGIGNSLHAGAIDPADEEDYYRLIVTATVSLEAELFQPTSGSCDSANLVVSLLGSNLAVATTGTARSPACSVLDGNDVRLSPGTYYLRVDNVLIEPVDILDYELSIRTVELGVCGNAILDPNEQCDDGNSNAGDGCNACNFELAGTVSLPLAAPAVFSGSIDRIGGADTYQIVVPAQTSYLGAQTYTLAPGTCAINAGLAVWSQNQITGQYSIVHQEVAAGCESIPIPALRLAAGTHYLQIFSTTGGTLASYDLSLTGSPADICGNALVEPPEGCDDGNQQSGDLCSAQCVFEAESCAAGFVVQRPGLRLAGTDFNVFANDHVLSGTGCLARTGTQREVVFQVDLLAGETLRVSENNASFDATVSLQRGGCGNTATCEYSSSTTENFTYFATVAETVFVVIENVSETSTSRTYDIIVEIIPQICGDGLVIGLEECDDGNVSDADGCTSTCQSAADSCNPLVVLTDDYNMLGRRIDFLGNDFTLPAGAGCTVRTNLPDAVFAVELQPGQRVEARELSSVAQITVSIVRGTSCQQAVTSGTCAGSSTTEETGISYTNTTGATEVVFVTYEPDSTTYVDDPYEVDISVQ